MYLRIGGRLIIEVIKCYEEKFPQRLLQIGEYPEQLYCKGDVGLLNTEKIVAIVGSRNCSEYGRKYANIFATELAKHGICVISGMAIGIDASAHCGAMHEKGKTIAVLGGGFKYIYPTQNLWLYNNIIDVGGCVITEYAEDEETQMSNFPKRNRLISGLADAVLVIEAEHRSGSKITAKYAKLQKKNVYCIPVNLDQKNSSGIKELLIDGAKIVTTPQQLIEDLYGKKFYNDSCNLNEKEIKREQKVILGQESISVSREFSKIYELLEKEMNSEEISKKINKDVAEVSSMLTIMEIEGSVEQMPGNYYVRVDKKIS